MQTVTVVAPGYAKGIPLANPLVNGSGTLDALTAGTLGLGGFVTKTVTLRPLFTSVTVTGVYADRGTATLREPICPSFSRCV